MALLVRLFLRANFLTPADPKESFEGRTVLITGSNVGLGFEAAMKFVALGAAKVIMAVRSIEKGEKAKEAIEGQTGREGVIEVWELDMSSYQSIKKFADLAAKLDRIDITILNAGIRAVSYEESDYGWEQTLQVNTLSTVYLGILLLPRLAASRTLDWTPVLEIVSSGLYETATISAEHTAADNVIGAYSMASPYSPAQAYKFSKLFLELAKLQLASLTTGEDGKPQVIVTSVSPGLCKSQLGRGYSDRFWARLLTPLFHAIFFRTTEAGARTLVSGTTLGEDAHGMFWQHDQLKPTIPQYSDEEKGDLQKRVWFDIVNTLRKDILNITELIGRIGEATAAISQ